MFELIVGAVGGIVIYEKVKNYNFVRKMIKPVKEFEFTRIVMFDEGEYAIRRGVFGVYIYKNISYSDWEPKSSTYFKQCLGTLEDCQKWFSNGTPV